jgi:hypothetical protein
LDENPFANDLAKRLVFENENHFEMNLKFDPYLYDPFIDDDLNDPLMAALFPAFMVRYRFFDDHRRHRNDAQEEEYCSEIVQKLRQSTNTLVDEMGVSRKEFDEKNANATKEIVGGIKEFQSEISKALLEELPKALKDIKHN